MKKRNDNISMNKIIQGYLESIKQGIEILESLSVEEYTKPAKPILDFSIGTHFRHILDLYNAIKIGFDSDLINYDIRRRGHTIERDIKSAKAELQALKAWITFLNESDFEKTILVKSEVSLSENQSVEIQSFLAREILFASSHAIHHYAIISTAMKLFGLDVNEKIGYAPSTASFLRDTE